MQAKKLNEGKFYSNKFYESKSPRGGPSNIKKANDAWKPNKDLELFSLEVLQP